MSRNNRYLTTLPDGTLLIIQPNCEDGSPAEAGIIVKTLFEHSRLLLDSGDPSMTSEELHQWQMNIHVVDYAGPLLLTSRPIVESDLLADRYFRDAWEDLTTSVGVNMPKARVIQMDHIRRIRDQELVRLDIEFIRAVEVGDTAEQTRIASLKQTLRDIPTTFDLTVFSTPEDLKNAWPTELL